MVGRVSKIDIKPFIEITFFIFPFQTFIFAYAMTDGQNLTVLGSEVLLLILNYIFLSIVNWKFGQKGISKIILFIPAVVFIIYLLSLEADFISFEDAFMVLVSVPIAFIFVLFFSFSAWIPFLVYALRHGEIHFSWGNSNR